MVAIIQGNPDFFQIVYDLIKNIQDNIQIINLKNINNSKNYIE